MADYGYVRLQAKVHEHGQSRLHVGSVCDAQHQCSYSMRLTALYSIIAMP